MGKRKHHQDGLCRIRRMNAIRGIVVSIGILNLALASTVAGQDVEALIDQLGSWSKDRAKRASDELAAMGKPVVSEVAKALGSKSRRRGRFAARTLRDIGQNASDAIPALCDSLDDSDALTREYAVEALGKMVKQASQVMPVLQKATQDENGSVGENARLAIARLTGLLESQGGADSAPESGAGIRNAETAGQSKEIVNVVQSEPSQSNEPHLSDDSVVTGTDSWGERNHSWKPGLMMSVRFCLLAFVLAGFFVLLHTCRE